jgi:hypothetical protein
MKRPLRLFSIAIAITLVSALAATIAAGSPSRSSDLPIIATAMDQTSIAVGGTLVSGAVDIRFTATVESEGQPALFRLNPGVSAAQLAVDLAASNGDPNSLAQDGSIVLGAYAPRGTIDVQTILQPGDYYAVDTAVGNGPAD